MRNKFPGQCYRCQKLVEAGAGYFERHQGRFRVQHVECCKAARDGYSHQKQAGMMGKTIKEPA